MQSLLEAWVARIAGLALIAFSAIGWLSIITWSNLDPSLTHTTAEPTRNLLGPLGAIISDLLLQTLGIGALLALGGPLILGLELASARRVPRLTRKLIVFPLSILVLAGGLSGLPTLPSWPLHHGYGGLLGDLVFNMLYSLLVAVIGERAGMAAGISLLAGGGAILIGGLGLSLKDLFSGAVARLPSRHASEDALAHAASGPAVTAEADDDFDDDEDERDVELPIAHEPAFDTVLVATLDDEPALRQEPSLSIEPIPTMPPAPVSRKPKKSVTSAQVAAPAVAAVAPSDPMADLNDDDPAHEEARAFARRFAPASATAAAASAAAAAATPAASPAAVDGVANEVGIGPHKLPAMLRGFSTARPSGWRRPQLGLLKAHAPRGEEITPAMLHERAAVLVDVLADFGVQGEVRDVRYGPVVTLFEFQPARGIKTQRIIALADDIARAMSANTARVATMPGRTTIGIELPNPNRETVLLRDVIDSDAFAASQATLPLALGCLIGGEPVIADLARMPHLLVAGTTGSGKSVGINAMILSLLFKHDPRSCRLLLIDPKMLELSAYDGIPHLLSPVVTDPAQAVQALDWAVAEMEERYKRMARLGVRNIETFNHRVDHANSRGEVLERTVQTGFDPRTGEPVYERQLLEEDAMAHIVIVVDEFADLMMTAGRQVEVAVQRLAQKARAAGIHLIMATQRPSVDVVTGTIKANFPTRLSFRVASKVDSRTILGETGAEQLLGQGDMLLAGGAGQPLRIHGAYVAEDEIEAVVGALRAQGRPEYDSGVTRSPTIAPDPAAKRMRKQRS